jgi:UDP-glucose 4-epimerase
MASHRSRILITGGAGFVGRPLVRRLAPDHDVLVLDALHHGADRFSTAERDRFRLVEADIGDGGAVAHAIAAFAPEIIIHLAAMHFIPDCERDPAAAIATNLIGTVHLLTAAPPGCRFVLASSGAVYQPDDQPHREDSSPLGPADIYGLTKLQAEHYLAHFAQSRGLDAIAVRLFNVVGPGETNRHIVPEIVAQMRRRQRRIALGNLWPRRDYLHVEDAAAGFEAVALRGSRETHRFRAVNLGSARAYSVSEILLRLAEISGMVCEIETDAARIRPVDRPFLAADIARIADEFGWSPLRTLDDALRDLWSNPDFTPRLAASLGAGGCG